ncbi:hypothetical protein ACFE04_019781 [Oxalis oulophora]
MPEREGAKPPSQANDSTAERTEPDNDITFDESTELTDNDTAASSEEGIPENEKPVIPTPAMPTLYMYPPKKMNKQKKRNRGFLMHSDEAPFPYQSPYVPVQVLQDWRLQYRIRGRIWWSLPLQRRSSEVNAHRKGWSSIERRRTDQRERGPTNYKRIHNKIELHSCPSRIKLTAPPLRSDSINHMFAFLSQVMVTRRRLGPRNMLTKTSGKRVTLEVNDQRCPLTMRRLVPLLIDSAMNMNEEMNSGLFLSLLTPRSFLMLILYVSSSPKLVVFLLVWVQLDGLIRQVKAFYPCRIGTNHHCIALEQLSGRRPATSVHIYGFILRTRSNLTLRGLVRSKSCLAFKFKANLMAAGKKDDLTFSYKVSVRATLVSPVDLIL